MRDTPVLDYRDLALKDDKSHLIVPGPRDTVVYQWANFAKIGTSKPALPQLKTWPEFMEFCQQRCDLPYQSVDTVCLNAGRLLVDAWCDQYKWGRARTIYSPSLVPLLKRIWDSRLIERDQTPIHFGNWASGESYEPIGTLDALTEYLMCPDHLVLYHGTTSENAREICEIGFTTDTVSLNKVRKKAIYFSGSAFRASYYARTAVKTQKAHWKKSPRLAKSAALLQPVVLQVRLPMDLREHLIPDEDWLNVAKWDKVPAGSGWDSLCNFGQVGLPEVPKGVPVKAIKFKI